MPENYVPPVYEYKSEYLTADEITSRRLEGWCLDVAEVYRHARSTDNILFTCLLRRVVKDDG